MGAKLRHSSTEITDTRHRESFALRTSWFLSVEKRNTRSDGPATAAPMMVEYPLRLAVHRSSPTISASKTEVCRNAVGRPRDTGGILKLDASPANRRRRACSLTSSTPILPSLTKRSHARLHLAPARTKLVTVSRASVENSLNISNTFNYLKHDATLPPKYPTPDTWRTVRPLPSTTARSLDSTKMCRKCRNCRKFDRRFSYYEQLPPISTNSTISTLARFHRSYRHLSLPAPRRYQPYARDQPCRTTTKWSQSTRCISSTEIPDT